MIVTNLVRISGRLVRWLIEHTAAAGVNLGLVLCLVVFGWVGTLAAVSDPTRSGGAISVRTPVGV